ncbi:hypothetical protein PQ455_12645 [Sphingomonas naphthae]|uniref:Uncharacterized protein n=1 Tax=Sphingomonas naphthae TaxID=1813468 RepID=A0ABY7THS3_9SPHN|nr:hypothetical protein [Sphingomonas naphthae]WCT72480.1 hypothetical protein PQ455_12645 [Sphingomonas naphthae]
MLKGFMMIVAIVGVSYAKEEGLPRPELVGEKAVARQAIATDACTAAFATSLYAVQYPDGLPRAAAVVEPGGRGMTVRWDAGSIAATPALAVECYATATSVVHLSVNGDTIIGYAE